MAESVVANERREDVEGGDNKKSSKYWQQELAAAHLREKTWRENVAPEIIKKYRDQRARLQKRTNKRFNILWSNTEILKSALYSSSANPDVRRRFGTSDKIARQGALVLERGLAYCGEDYDLDCVIEQCLEDALLPGRGQGWVVYTPTVESDGEKSEGEEPTEQVTAQELMVDYVHWSDYREGIARTWKKMPWVGRRHLFSRDDLDNEFPKHAKDIPLNHTIGPEEKKRDTDQQTDTFKRAEVWEIWDKTRKERVYIVEGYSFILKVNKDPYGLKRFFPCPDPLRKVRANDDRIPVPEPILYWDQIEELDRITTRIVRLTNVLKWRGVYDASDKENNLANLPQADDNTFLPHKSFSQLLEKGGLAQAFQTLDLKPVVEALLGLYQNRDKIIETIYQLTGISDIVRGSTDPRETKGAQQLKAQFGSMRMQKSQNEVQRFIRDLYRIKAEILAEHFEPDILAEMTGVEMPTDEDIQAQVEQLQAQAGQALQGLLEQTGGEIPPEALQQIEQGKAAMDARLAELNDMPTWGKVMKMLRSDKARGYKIDIETDTTALQDAEAEKASRMEFLEVITRLFGETIPAMQQFPASIPLVRESVMFVVRSHKVGRVLEEAIEDAFNEIENQPPQQEQTDPKVEAMKAQMDLKMQELQAKIEAMAKEFELKQQQMQAELQAEREKNEAQIQMKDREMQADIARDDAALNADMQREDAKAQAEQQRDDARLNADLEHEDMQARITAARTQQQETVA